jgi:hypothetical protein
VITAAVKKFPDSIFAISGETSIARLKSRRDLMEVEGMKYYRFISDYVTIVGSNKPEYFKVSKADGNNLKVLVYERINQVDTGFRLYQRVFNHRETKELRLFGLHGNDLFEVDDDVRSKILIRIIGGKGNDTFDIKGHVATQLYDIDTSANYVLNKSNTRLFFSTLPSVNAFDWTENQYPSNRFPRIMAGFNTDDGLFVGAGFWRKTFGFRKEPFATENRFAATYAFRGALKFRYQGEFNHVFRNIDIVAKAEYADPALNNFFGLGNNTELDSEKNMGYYRARYNYMDATLLFRKKIFNVLSVMGGPWFYRYWNNPKNNIGKILEMPSVVGLDSSEVYTSKSYLGAKLIAEVNNINNELFPTRGMQWNTELSFLSGVTGSANAVTRLVSDMTVYASLSSPATVVTVIRVGGGHIFNDNFEYFQALNLGANNYLRGFRKNRFAGSSLAYGSLEMRVKLFSSKWYILPGDFGVLGFGDAGRVWMKNMPSRRWHTAIGGGIYYVPFNMVLVSASLAYSKEATLFNFSVGTKINITF